MDYMEHYEEMGFRDLMEEACAMLRERYMEMDEDDLVEELVAMQRSRYGEMERDELAEKALAARMEQCRRMDRDGLVEMLTALDGDPAGIDRGGLAGRLAVAEARVAELEEALAVARARTNMN